MLAYMCSWDLEPWLYFKMNVSCINHFEDHSIIEGKYV